MSQLEYFTQIFYKFPSSLIEGVQPLRDRTIFISPPEKSVHIFIQISLPDPLRMHKRPVGQDLPTKEGQGGLGPRTNYLGSLILSNQDNNRTSSNHFL